MYEERNQQEQHYWRDRLLRERRNISQSVEETLADDASQEEWTDDAFDEDVDEPARSNTSLVPPLLSLQSKELSSVQPPTFVQSVTAELAVQRSKEGEERQKVQHSGILARFAQHVTSSLAAFGSAIQPVPLENMPFSPPIPSYVDERLSASPPSSLKLEEVQRLPSVAVVNAIPASSSITATPPVRSKQRLAGHTSKIRLQTSPAPRMTPLSRDAVAQEWGHEFYENEAALPPVRAENGSTSDVGMCASFFGSGVFEKGQRELMVRNERTTMMSIIHITLTSNPGPTLVQFISLHTGMGFTLHLTAPTTEKTTFNYVLLVDSSK